MLSIVYWLEFGIVYLFDWLMRRQEVILGLWLHRELTNCYSLAKSQLVVFQSSLRPIWHLCLLGESIINVLRSWDCNEFVTMFLKLNVSADIRNNDLLKCYICYSHSNERFSCLSRHWLRCVKCKQCFTDVYVESIYLCICCGGGLAYGFTWVTAFVLTYKHIIHHGLS